MNENSLMAKLINAINNSKVVNSTYKGISRQLMPNTEEIMETTLTGTLNANYQRKTGTMISTTLNSMQKIDSKTTYKNNCVSEVITTYDYSSDVQTTSDNTMPMSQKKYAMAFYPGGEMYPIEPSILIPVKSKSNSKYCQTYIVNPKTFNCMEEDITTTVTLYMRSETQFEIKTVTKIVNSACSEPLYSTMNSIMNIIPSCDYK